MAVPWLVRFEPIPGEILSGYLVRCAHSNGMTPYRFTSFHCRGIPVWNRDIDRSATDALIEQVSQGSGVSIDRVVDMTLRSLSLLPGVPDTTHAASLAIAPWINALGVYNRVRRRHGMQFCPRCLAADGTYKKIWRLAFMTVCPIHHCWLRDGCRHCDAQVAYHRNDALYLHCHRCGRPMLSTGLQCDPAADEVGALLRFQATLFSAIEHGECVLGGERIGTPELFSGMSSLFSAVKAGIRVDRHRTKHLVPSLHDFPTQRTELLRVAERARQCRLMADLLDDWPSALLDIAERLRLTQRYFPFTTPSWVRKAVNTLPIGSSRIRRSVAVASTCRRLRALQRRKCEGWRTERARILMQRALYGR